MCKVCDLKFSKKNTDLKPLKLLCPYCGRVLSFKKKRKNFNIHKCVNNSCPYYANALKSLSPEDLLEYEKDEHKFKLRYIYREFTEYSGSGDTTCPVLGNRHSGITETTIPVVETVYKYPL